jgi:pheromone shutdown protein TraB
MEQDMLEKLLLEMSDQYPELSRVFVNERDQFLSYSLRKCAQQIPIETNETGFVPATVVGVVGIGHVQGIIKQWNQPTINDIQHLMTL